MRTLLLLALTVSLTGCQCAPRMPSGFAGFRCGKSGAKPSCDDRCRDDAGCHRDQQSSSGCRASASGSRCPQPRGGSCSALTMGWTDISVPVVKLRRVSEPARPTCEPRCSSPPGPSVTPELSLPPATPEPPKVVEDPEVAACRKQMESLQLQVQELRGLVQQQSRFPQPMVTADPRVQGTNLPSPGYVPSFDPRPIQQMGASQSSHPVLPPASQPEMWPYSPQSSGQFLR